MFGVCILYFGLVCLLLLFVICVCGCVACVCVSGMSGVPVVRGVYSVSCLCV